MRVKTTTLIFAAASLAAGPAAAAHCLPGQFYRVKLDECVCLASALAWPFLDEATRKTTPLVKPVRMPKLADPGFVDPPQEVPNLALPKADHTNDPPDEDDNRIGLLLTRLPLLGLQALGVVYVPAAPTSGRVARGPDVAVNTRTF